MVWFFKKVVWLSWNVMNVAVVYWVGIRVGIVFVAAWHVSHFAHVIRLVVVIVGISVYIEIVEVTSLHVKV